MSITHITGLEGLLILEVAMTTERKEILTTESKKAIKQDAIYTRSKM